ncbi:MAG: hypothetical protein ABI548_20960 [Polyangiaceae bacterium]
MLEIYFAPGDTNEGEISALNVRKDGYGSLVFNGASLLPSELG